MKSARSDQEIWTDILSGNSGAWKELVDRYQALVYTVATRARLSMADAEDCFQNTWAKLWSHRKRITHPERISAWLVTTAKREAIRLARGSAGRTDLDDIVEPEDTAARQDEKLEQIELQHHLETALAQLDERCRKLLDALFFAPEDWTYERLADELCLALNSLGAIRGRCLNRLKRQLADNGYLNVRNTDPKAL